MNENIDKQEVVVPVAKKEEVVNKGFGKFLKAAGIISIIFFSSYLLIQTILTIVSWFNGSALSVLDAIIAKMFIFLFNGLLVEGAIAFLTLAFSLTYSILCVVFACKVLSCASKNLKDAYKSSNALIAYSVVFLVWLTVPISIIIDQAIPIFVLAILLIVLSIVFIVVDTVKIKRLYKADKKCTMVNVDELEKQLKRLEDLKNNKTITEEEYNNLRNNVLRKFK